MPAPACTYMTPSLISAVRSTMQVSISLAGGEIADAAGIERALLLLQFVDDLHGAHFRRAGHRAGGKSGGERVERIAVLAQLALDVGDDVHHLAVALDEELVGDLDACRFRRRGRRRCGRGRAASDARRAPWDRRAVRLRAPCLRAASRRAAACRRSGGWSRCRRSALTRISGLDPAMAKLPKSRKNR